MTEMRDLIEKYDKEYRACRDAFPFEANSDTFMPDFLTRFAKEIAAAIKAQRGEDK